MYAASLLFLNHPFQPATNMTGKAILHTEFAAPGPAECHILERATGQMLQKHYPQYEAILHEQGVRIEFRNKKALYLCFHPYIFSYI